MEEWLQQFFAWIPVGWPYYTVIGLVAFAESLAFAGIFVPGSVIVVFTGFLAANGRGELLPLLLVSFIGSLGGDLLSFELGRRHGTALMERYTSGRFAPMLARADLFFADHGGKSVLLGRFVGFLRPFIPFVAGTLGMRPLPFTLWALIGGVLWGLAYPGLGYLGGASWQMVQLWTGRFSLLILVIVALFVLNALFWRHLAHHLTRLVSRGGRHIADVWRHWLVSPLMQSVKADYPRGWEFVRARLTLEHGSGLYLTVGFVTSLTFALLFAWVGRVTRATTSLSAIDQSLYDFALSLHHPLGDRLFIAITMLAGAENISLFALCILLWLILNNRDFTAGIFASGLLGGELLVYLLKHLVDRPRPTPFFPELHVIGASFPSAHAFTVTVLLGLYVYFLLGTIRAWQGRTVLILCASFAVLLVGLSRIYLGVHWLSDVLGGMLLAGLWLTFLITACELRYRYKYFPVQRGWRPLKLTPRQRWTILVPALLITTLLVCHNIAPWLEHLDRPAAAPATEARHNGEKRAADIRLP